MAIERTGDNAKPASSGTGTLRIAVAVGPALSATWCVENDAGEIVGVAADIGRELARRLGLGPALIAYPSSGAIVADGSAGTWDVAFVPADEKRKRQLSFGPNFFLGDSTYLIGNETGIDDLASVDQPGRTIAGIEGTATLRAARRGLRNAATIGLDKLDDVVALFETGSVDAIALGRESLASLQKKLRRSSIVLADSFHSAGSALAVPPDRDPAKLGGLLEAAKSDGTLRAIFDRHGLNDLPVAPLGSRP